LNNIIIFSKKNQVVNWSFRYIDYQANSIKDYTTDFQAESPSKFACISSLFQAIDFLKALFYINFSNLA